MTMPKIDARETKTVEAVDAHAYPDVLLLRFASRTDPATLIPTLRVVVQPYDFAASQLAPEHAAQVIEAKIADLAAVAAEFPGVQSLLASVATVVAALVKRHQIQADIADVQGQLDALPDGADDSELQDQLAALQDELDTAVTDIKTAEVAK